MDIKGIRGEPKWESMVDINQYHHGLHYLNDTSRYNKKDY